MATNDSKPSVSRVYDELLFDPSITLHVSGAETVTHNNDDSTNWVSKGVRLFLDITVAAGTSPTLDIKVQVKDPLTNNYHDLTGAAFAQKVTTGQDELVIYPGIGETANKAVSDVLSRTWRTVATITGSAGQTFTYTLAAEYIV